jgi:hypothetical protein
MISLELAEKLAAAGLAWEPSRGDHFVLPHREMDEQVFVLSDMTIEVHQFPAGEVIGFNGTVEWALDSIERHEALWLPREDQLREALGDAFVSLVRVPDGFRCDLVGASATGSTCEEAYGLALLAVLADTAATPSAIP